jgi:Plasmid pRiA4b ORF-3-like protein
MAVYRFKATFEDDEEIYREIEIKSTQNFEDFHAIILKSFNFDGNHDASFFISDDYWRKGEEIVLHPHKESDKKNRQPEPPKRIMNKCKMAALIDDPHQKFVYIYDHQSYYTFMVELLKIVADDPKASYPKCVKTVGVPPKNTKIPVVVPDDLDDDDFDDEHPDDEAYVNAHSEDEISDLEGEEGEEDETEEMEEVADEDADFEELNDEHFEED